MSDRDRIARIHAREAGLRRLRTWKRIIAVGATLLAGLIALVTAATAPGKKLVRTLPSTRARVVRPHLSSARRATASAHSAVRTVTHATTAAPTVQAPAQAPVQVAAQPVVVSGGS